MEKKKRKKIYLIHVKASCQIPLVLDRVTHTRCQRDTNAVSLDQFLNHFSSLRVAIFRCVERLNECCDITKDNSTL
jgi:hypothetical protein